MSTEHPSAFFTLPGADVGDGSGEGVRCPDQDGRGIVRSHRKKLAGRPAASWMLLRRLEETGRRYQIMQCTGRSVGRPARERRWRGGLGRPTDGRRIATPGLARTRTDTPSIRGPAPNRQ